MLTLTRSTDVGTQTLTVTLSEDGTEVFISSYTDGELDLVSADVIDTDAWLTRLGHYQDAGYRETGEKPDIRVTIDPARCTVSFAGGPANQLHSPDTNDEDDYPHDPLTEQADELIGEVGFIRVTSWWATPDGRLAAVMVPDAESALALDVAAAVHFALSRARDAVLAMIGWGVDGMPDSAVADRILLSGDVTRVGYDQIVAEVFDNRAYPPSIRDGLGELAGALVFAEKGDIAETVRLAAQVTAGMTPATGDG